MILMMRLTMSLRQEIHDAACDRCCTPKAADMECAPCAFENARIGAAGSVEIAARYIDAAEAARNERRKENS